MSDLTVALWPHAYPKLFTPEEQFRIINPGVLRIYDASNDEYRNATQDDLDRALVAALHGASIRESAIRFHEEWRTRFKPNVSRETAL